MRILALIAARGGSKRLPGKNIRLLGPDPLIVWSIKSAQEVAEICDILVSTDDPKIAAVAREGGALVPWLRPAELATDTASSLDTSLHALQSYEEDYGKVDGLLLLQPTSPFRSRATVRRGIELFRQSGRRAVIGVSPAASHPMWCFTIQHDGLRPFIEGGGLHLRSQDLPPAYVVNGAYYLIDPERLRSSRSFFSEDMVPMTMDVMEGLDLDTEWDWKMAESALSLRQLDRR